MADQLKIEKKPGEELEVKVIDGDGEEHDITQAFRQISGATTQGGQFTNSIQVQDEKTAVTINFTARGKELTFDLEPATVRQLLALV